VCISYIASHIEYVYLLHFVSYSTHADTLSLSYSVTERVTGMLLDKKIAGCVISRFIGATASSRQVVCEGERERVCVSERECVGREGVCESSSWQVCLCVRERVRVCV